MFSFTSNLWFNKRCINASTGEVSLYLQVVIDRTHDEFKLHLRWPAKFVDSVKGVLLARKKNDPDVVDFNLIIQSERAKHTEIQRAYRIRNEVLCIVKFAREVKVFDDRECFLSYLERERNSRYRKRQIEEQTWENAHATKMAIIKYDPVALFSNITKKWMMGFKNHLKTIEWAPGKKYKPGTVWDRIKTVKAYLQLASEEPMIYVDKEALDFPNPKPTTITTFLNKDELRRLIILERSGNLTMTESHVIRAFLFSCFTSLRISDVYRAGSNWQITANYLQFIPHKNRKDRKTLIIPLVDMARQFIDHHEGFYFELPSTQEYNRTLKELAFKAEIYKNITSHVARHTFGYLFMTTVGNIYALMKILGHSKVETTERYAHLDDDYQLEAVNLMQKDFEDLRPKKLSLVGA